MPDLHLNPNQCVSTKGEDYAIDFIIKTQHT